MLKIQVVDGYSNAQRLDYSRKCKYSGFHQKKNNTQYLKFILKVVNFFHLHSNFNQSQHLFVHQTYRAQSNLEPSHRAKRCWDLGEERSVVRREREEFM